MSQIENFRIAVSGGGGAGKSCLTIQFVQNQFVDTYDPTIEDSYQKQINIDKTEILLDILDTAGQEEYKMLRDEYIRNADGFILVFDWTVRKTFDELKDFHKHICQTKDTNYPPIILAANKCDLDESLRKVTKEEIEDLASKWRVKYLETSSKTRKNVDQLFHGVVKVIMEQKAQKVKTTTKGPRKQCNII